MKFNSLVFLFFFIVVYTAYIMVSKNRRKQNLILLTASYIFYGWWDARFLFLIILSTFIDYICSYIISYGANAKSILRKSFLFVLISIPLFLFVGWNDWINNLNIRSIHLPKLLFDSNSIIIMISSVILLGILTSAFYLLCQQKNRDTQRKIALMISIIANLSILGFFKYFNFFSESLSSFWMLISNKPIDSLTLNIILPVGISFYTFQTMSYTIDVYKKDLTATKSLLNLAVYVAFFPQLVAGPIERGIHLLPQFEKNRILKKEDIKSGLWLILWGFYKKIVVADNMAIIVNNVFSPYDSNPLIMGIPKDGLSVLIAIIAFAFQIYGDFSGYTDIARGTARMMGFDIMLNFNVPYVSRTPSDFWNRWHISLSSWLKDYLYIPLGGNRNGKLRTYRNLFLTMLLGGLWHGAAWNFILWGAFHGAILIIYRLFFPKIDRTPKYEFPIYRRFIQWLIMWNLTCFGWLVFRARNLKTIYYFILAIFTNMTVTPIAIEYIKTLVIFLWFLIIYQVIQYKKNETEPINKFPRFVRFNIFLFLICSILFLFPSESQEFIYFAF